MIHEPVAKEGNDNAITYKSRLGVKLFFVYLFIYGGFVLICTVNPKLMGIKTISGLNLAVFYGFGLIIFAILLGLVYNHLCTKEEKRVNTK